jgi:hypothetical protein
MLNELMVRQRGNPNINMILLNNDFGNFLLVRCLEILLHTSVPFYRNDLCLSWIIANGIWSLVTGSDFITQLFSSYVVLWFQRNRKRVSEARTSIRLSVWLLPVFSTNVNIVDISLPFLKIDVKIVFLRNCWKRYMWLTFCLLFLLRKCRLIFLSFPCVSHHPNGFWNNGFSVKSCTYTKDSYKIRLQGT